jgi:predicted site-specific integrase-resolvase
MTQQPVLLTTRQAVQLLASLGVLVSANQLRAWTQAGRVEAVRLPSGNYLFQPSVIEAIARPIPAAAAPAA